MTPEQRVKEIYDKADRQLLIGLMETTTGQGFTQIVANDFKSVGDDRFKKFLIIVGLASIHRSTLSSHIVGSALSNLGILEDINVMSRETDGIIGDEYQEVFGSTSGLCPRTLREGRPHNNDHGLFSRRLGSVLRL